MGAAERGCEVEFIRAMDLDIKHCTGCITCVKMLMSGRGNMCIHKDDFDWLFFKMAEADGIVICDPIFETGASGLFHTIMDRFGPRMDTGNNVISTQIAQKIIAEGGKAKLPDPRIICPGKPISYIGIGGSDWGTHVQSDHAIQAMTPTWRVIDNEWVPWSKRALLDDEVVARVHQIGTNMANAAKDPEHAAYQGEDGTCPHCHANDYYLVPDTDKAICSAMSRSKAASSRWSTSTRKPTTSVGSSAPTTPPRASRSTARTSVAWRASFPSSRRATSTSVASRATRRLSRPACPCAPSCPHRERAGQNRELCPIAHGPADGILGR